MGQEDIGLKGSDKDKLPIVEQSDRLIPFDFDPGVLEKDASHIKARLEKPSIYPDRYEIPESFVSWDIPFENYNPPYYVAPQVIENDSDKKLGGWADPEDVEKVRKIRSITSYEGEVLYDQNGRPLNPRGRTGVSGRGLWGKWGPNYAADPIVTRLNSQTGKLEIILIRRKDTGEWALPGGMVDAGERVSRTLERELGEESGVNINFESAEKVYEGYVDDPRNTDNAWGETSAYHLHLAGEEGLIELKAGDDAGAAQWQVVNENTLGKLYASHGSVIKMAINGWQERTGFVLNKEGLVGKGSV